MGQQELVRMLDAAGACSEFETVYYNYQDLPHWLTVLGINGRNLSNAHWQQIKRLQLRELKDMSQCCADRGVTQISVTENPGIDLYFLHTRVTADWMPKACEPDISEYQTWFGVEANLPRWDLREKIALDIRPFERNLLQNYVSASCDHHCVTALDLWLDGEHAVAALMRELHIDLDHDRLDHWQRIYRQWQQSQLPFVRFAWQALDMVDAMVSNRRRHIPKLSLLQEAALQHCLIYLHDLNLRNWQLEHFPDCARDLHKLLCSNEHHVDLTYRDLLRRSIDSLRSSI